MKGRAEKGNSYQPPSRRKTNPNAAGIDLGATVHYVAVPAERDPQPVRHFGALTEDLEALAAASSRRISVKLKGESQKRQVVS